MRSTADVLRERILARLSEGKKALTAVGVEGAALNAARESNDEADAAPSTATTTPLSPPSPPPSEVEPVAIPAVAVTQEAQHAELRSVQVELARRDRMLWQMKEQLAAEQARHEEHMQRALALIEGMKRELDEERVGTEGLRASLADEQRRHRISLKKLERSRERERVLAQTRRRRYVPGIAATTSSSSSSSEED